MDAYKTLELGGKTVRYIDRGSGEQTVLLLHGWGVSASVYHLIIDHLSRRCRVVAPDLPGFGGTFVPDTSWDSYDYVRFVREFADALGLTDVVLMGHSHGGRVSIRILAEPFLTVKKAVLLDSAGLPAHHDLKWHIKVKSYKAGKAILSWKPIQALFPDALANFQKNAGSSDYRQASPVMKQTMNRVLAEDVSADLPKIAASTLLIWGDQDDATPLSDGQKMEKLIPDAGLVVLNGGHFAFAENWTKTAAILDSFI